MNSDKRCEVCGKQLRFDNTSGRCQKHRPHDPDKRREIYRRYYLKRKTLIDEIKVSQGCADCGYNLHPEALDFDHLPGTDKLFNISQEKDGTMEAILAEIEKCEVVCANCHRVRTTVRFVLK